MTESNQLLREIRAVNKKLDDILALLEVIANPVYAISDDGTITIPEHTNTIVSGH